ncbi:MAG TPA: nicotinate-nucleotide--dimethylbenzimidazole phosphoribosyltransferase [Gaiellaceae bacterium]
MSRSEHFERPALPPEFDDSRARERRDDPAGWRLDDAERAGVWRAIAERRDIRRFRPDPLADDILHRLLEAAHQAPSVGLMQPWRFIVIRDEETKTAMQAIAQRERLLQADHFDERTRQFLDLKIEGIRDAPVSICVCCDRGEDEEVLGRHTIRDTDLYSTCLAIENLWLAARAEGIGVGWVSFYREPDLQSLLELPERVVPVAWLCLGYPDERPTRPGLEAAGWDKRRPLERFVHRERWCEHSVSTNGAAMPARKEQRPLAQPPGWALALLAAVGPGDPAAAIGIRDASDELVKPAGSLGALETLLERWAIATGAPPPPEPRVAILVFAADHGVARYQVSLYPARVGAQVAAAAARHETAIGVLADAHAAELIVADVGLAGPRAFGVIDRRVVDGSADITLGPASTSQELRTAIEAGHELGSSLAERCDTLVLGEIGIGNTTVASALLAALTGLPADAVCGRGTGVDAQGLARKRKTVATALAVNAPDRRDPLECLRRVGGLELAALVGALLAAAAAKRPVVLDGFAVGVAALVACRLQPAVRDYLVAGHRSAEPAHHHVLTELGLEPLLDLRLRLGEASGAALALPLISLAARLHHNMRRFDEAGVDRAESSR